MGQLGASPERDRAFRQMAIDVIGQMERRTPDILQELRRKYVPGRKLPSIRWTEQIELRPELFDGARGEVPLNVLLRAGSLATVGSHAAYSPDTNTIVLSYPGELVMKRLLEGDLRRASVALSNTAFRAQAFHELIHYFDDLRGSQFMPRASYAGPEEDFVAYINSPEELNAFYQHLLAQAMPKWNDYVAKHGPEEAANMSFYDFAEMFLDHPAAEDFVPDLTEKNRRKFKARLYQTFDYLKGRL